MVFIIPKGHQVVCQAIFVCRRTTVDCRQAVITEFSDILHLRILIMALLQPMGHQLSIAALS